MVGRAAGSCGRARLCDIDRWEERDGEECEVCSSAVLPGWKNVQDGSCLRIDRGHLQSKSSAAVVHPSSYLDAQTEQRTHIGWEPVFLVG